ncbi:MAG TPA: hypothetical protein VJ869_04085 [Sphaerochaeta sp.]|nr:hypothetical protein [Sphaerochaeta sp.]
MENNVILSQDAAKAEQMKMVAEFMDDGTGCRITAQDVRRAVMDMQEAQAKETKRVEDNILTMLKIKDCIFPDGTTFHFDRYTWTPYITALNYEGLKEIRKTLLKAKLKYSDKISSVSPTGYNDNAIVSFSTSLGINLNMIIPIEGFPKELLPSEECFFDKKQKQDLSVSEEWELSCPLRK